MTIETNIRAAPTSFLASTSLRLDELVVQGESLRHALQGVPQGTLQATRLADALVICEDERMSLEAELRL